jgi:hypothetical protein
VTSKVTTAIAKPTAIILFARTLRSMNYDISSLTWASEWWEVAGYIATALVLIGVAGESVCQLTEWIKSTSRKHNVEKVSALVLIAALAGEILTQVESNNSNSLIVGVLNKQTVELQTQNAALLKSISPRRIASFTNPAVPPRELQSFCADIASFSAITFAIQSIPEFEARFFAQNLERSLMFCPLRMRLVEEADTGVSPLQLVDGIMLEAGFSFVDAGQPAVMAAEALARTLSRFGFGEVPVLIPQGPKAFPMGRTYTPRARVSGTEVVVLIGPRPIVAALPVAP